jgi:hypothetical protein
MIGDAMALDEGDEIGLGVAAQRGLAEVSVVRQKTIRRTLEIGKIAAPASRDQDLGADPIDMVEQ